MLKQKEKHFKAHLNITLDDLVPESNFYRQLEARLDLSFVRDLVRARYASRLGRPSIDPVVFFKLQLIMFFEGIRSERQLMEQVQVNLAYRWYIGYDLDEAVPDHSSLSKIRDRYGLEVFQRFFERVVELCLKTGLVWGKELYFDGTKVQANASITGMQPRFYVEAQQYLRAHFGQVVTPEESKKQSRGLVEKYNGSRFNPDLATTLTMSSMGQSTHYSGSIGHSCIHYG